MITVLLPTTNRAGMLATALRSIERQTAIGSVSEVIVSENAGCLASRDVCSGFPSLPIRYIFREPILAPLAHGESLIWESKGKYIAVLHDDDWWADTHLALALGYLERMPDVGSYWSSFLWVDGESSWMTFSDLTSLCWAASGFPPVTTAWSLDAKRAALACLLGTPVHYSTLLVQSDIYRQSYSAVREQANPFDNDRLLFMECAKHGRVIINPTPQALYRQHSGQDWRTFTSGERRSWVEKTAVAILDFCDSNGVNVSNWLCSILDDCPTADLHRFTGGAFIQLLMILRKREALSERLLKFIEPAPEKRESTLRKSCVAGHHRQLLVHTERFSFGVAWHLLVRHEPGRSGDAG